MGKEIILLADEERIIETEIDLDEVKNTRNKFRFLDDIKLI